MNKEQWNTIKKCAAMEPVEKTPVGLIVDSPWIPGYVGMSTMDYFTIPEKWFEANMKVKKDFADVIFIPDFWVEYGMALEPSGFGSKINFYENSTPTVEHLIKSFEDIEFINSIGLPNPKTDGLMPFALNLYKNMEYKVREAGESVKIVAARGPLTIASHLMGLTEFLIAIKIDPVNVKRLLKTTAALTKNWLEAQAEVLSEVEGVMILDDIVGFLSKEDYLEFAHPYMKEIFNSFSGNVKIYHNDMDNPVCYEFLEELGVNIFNFTHKQKISKVRELVGNKVCLLGNIPPLDVLGKGTPETVKTATKECLDEYADNKGLIISSGGGASPGTPAENILAMVKEAMSTS